MTIYVVQKVLWHTFKITYVGKMTYILNNIPNLNAVKHKCDTPAVSLSVYSISAQARISHSFPVQSVRGVLTVKIRSVTTLALSKHLNLWLRTVLIFPSCLEEKVRHFF